MYISNIIVFYIVIFNIVTPVQSLVELHEVEDNGVAVADSIIRRTVNQLFYKLKLETKWYKSRLKQLSAIHNFFSSISLGDHDNLKEVARLAKAERNIENSSQILMETLNELLNEDHKSEEIIEDENVTEYIETFLDKLRSLKQTFDSLGNTKDFTVNNKILNFIANNDHNITAYNNGSDNDYGILDDLEFWQPSGRRIFRGKTTKVKYFPFMASIQFFRKFQCAGSVIKSDLVITAASCLQLAYNNRFFRENPAFLSVRVGSNFYEYGGESIPVLEVYFNPGYNPKNLRNNLCLLRLQRRIIFRKRTRHMKKIDIDRKASMLPENTDGITIVGWGAKGTRNIVENVLANQMSYDVLDFFPLPECREIYSGEYVTKKNFCAGFFSKGGGACNRDVGGPGVVSGRLAGVISFGSPVCGATNAPTVFTKLGYYSDWIDNIMKMDVPTTLTKTTLKPPRSPPTPAEEWITQATTFKLEPIGAGKIKTTRIVDDEALRNIKEENELFTEFLKTMFGNEDIPEEEVQRMLEEVESSDGELVPPEDSKHHTVETHTTIPPKLAVTNIIPYYDSQEATMGAVDDKYNDEENNTDLEKDIMRLIEGLDVTSLLQDQNRSTKIQINDPKKVGQLKNDDVLTLLYLSDSEKNNPNEILSEQVSEGVNIRPEKFLDLTKRNRNREQGIAEEDLLNIISQAISSEIKNKT